MGLDRLSGGEKIAGASALLLYALMFFDWFVVESPDDDSLQLFPVGHNAWEALDSVPIVLVVTIFAALAVAVLPADAFRKLPVSANAVVAILGTVSALLILFRIVDPPIFGSRGTPFGTVTYVGTVQFPMFLALVAAVGIALGGCRAMQEEGFAQGSQELRHS